MIHALRRLFGATERLTWLGLSGSTTTFLRSDGAEATVGGAAGGGLVLLEQHTASASASLDFTACISGTYDEYQIEFINVIPATNNVDFYFRVSTNGGSSYDSTNTYQYNGFAWVSGGFGQGGVAIGAPTSQINISVSNGLTNNANWGLCGSMRLFSPGNTALYKRVTGQVSFHRNNGPDHLGIVLNGAYLSTTEVNAFQFLMASGNISSGTIRVYGIAK